MAEVGKHIKEIRKEKNLTQDDLAEQEKTEDQVGGGAWDGMCAAYGD